MSGCRVTIKVAGGWLDGNGRGGFVTRPYVDHNTTYVELVE